MIVLYQYCSISLLASKMIYKSSYQAIPNGRWFVFYFTHHTFLQTETTPPALLLCSKGNKGYQ